MDGQIMSLFENNFPLSLAILTIMDPFQRQHPKALNNIKTWCSSEPVCSCINVYAYLFTYLHGVTNVMQLCITLLLTGSFSQLTTFEYMRLNWSGQPTAMGGATVILVVFPSWFTVLVDNVGS